MNSYIPEEKITQEHLYKEYEKFSATISNGKKIFCMMIKNTENELSSQQQYELQHKHGMPFLLINKYRQELINKNNDDKRNKLSTSVLVRTAS